MKVHIMNSAMMPAPGRYTLEAIPLSVFVDAIRQAWQEGVLISSIGYPDNIRIIQEISSVRIPLSREVTRLEPGDMMLIMRLRYRPDNKRTTAPSVEDFDFFRAKYKK